jgi:hypothetical protein
LNCRVEIAFEREAALGRDDRIGGEEERRTAEREAETFE